MFTFGREHERECALSYLRRRDDNAPVTELVDAVHDFLNGECTKESLSGTIVNLFVEGSSGAWEQAGSWLRRLVHEDSDFQLVWRELAEHRKGTVRFRVACHINDMPAALARELGSRLAEDPHKKTRAIAKARLDELSDHPAS